jgi:hypothetical protein
MNMLSINWLWVLLINKLIIMFINSVNTITEKSLGIEILENLKISITI